MSAFAIAYEIGEELRASECWDIDMCAELCCIAGLDEEWCAADEETFECVVRRAAKVLGVYFD